MGMKLRLLQALVFSVFSLAVQAVPAQAFYRETHCSITQEALERTGFALDSLELVYFANRSVDRHEFNNVEAHFDSESFEAGSKRLVELAEQTVAAIKQNRNREAQVLIGRALHSIQDFFSHSNYVELQERQQRDIPIDFFNLKNPEKELPCNAVEGKFDGLTTGYYPDDVTPEIKCSHDTLNKDAPETPSGKNYHLQAIKKATQESIIWIKRIEDMVRLRTLTNVMAEDLLFNLKKFSTKVSAAPGVLFCEQLVWLPENDLDDATALPTPVPLETNPETTPVVAQVEEQEAEKLNWLIPMTVEPEHAVSGIPKQAENAETKEVTPEPEAPAKPAEKLKLDEEKPLEMDLEKIRARAEAEFEKLQKQLDQAIATARKKITLWLRKWF